MRIVAIPFACFLLLTVEALSQSSWKKVELTTQGWAPGSILNSVTTAGSLVLSTVSGGDPYKAVRSTDGGATWEPPTLTALAPLKLKSLSFTFLYGVRGDSVMTSTDQGLSWSIPNASVNLNMNLADVHYINPSSPTQAWAVGDSPYVSITSNNWNSSLNRRFPDDSVSMTSVQFFDNNFGFAAGRSTRVGSNAGIIFRTTDGGLSWEDRSLPDVCGSTPILVVDFVTPRIGWAVQTCNVTATIYKTADSGSTWSPQDTINISRIYAIDAVDSLHAWAVGQVFGPSGAIAKTSDGGSSWGITQPPSSGPLLSIAMRDTVNGFACGQAATLLVYAPVVTDVPGDRSNRPTSFELSQNYPNPFNGETRIAFTLKKSQPVTLSIYNILGQPVRKLVDATRPAGKNEASWDGRDERGLAVPSGIYLYKLSTLKENQVRRMVLLK